MDIIIIDYRLIKIIRKIIKHFSRFPIRNGLNRSMRIIPTYMIGMNDKGVIDRITQVYSVNGCSTVADITSSIATAAAIRIYKNKRIPVGYIQMSDTRLARINTPWQFLMPGILYGGLFLYSYIPHRYKNIKILGWRIGEDIINKDLKKMPYVDKKVNIKYTDPIVLNIWEYVKSNTMDSVIL